MRRYTLTVWVDDSVPSAATLPALIDAVGDTRGAHRVDGYELPSEGPHEVVEDVAGAGYPRLTCRTCEVTLLRAPWMSDIDWRRHVHEFRFKHWR